MMRPLLAILLALAIADPSQISSQAVRPLVVERNASAIDSAASPDRRGLLRIIVRAFDDPTVVVPQALIQLTALSGDSVAIPRTDANGTATVALNAERYRLRVRAIGYELGLIEFEVKPGCRSDLEIYLGYASTCLFTCPGSTARAVLTTCKVNGRGDR